MQGFSYAYGGTAETVHNVQEPMDIFIPLRDNVLPTVPTAAD